MKPFIIFGAGQLADYVWNIMDGALGYTVSAFTINQEYITEETLEKHNLPIVPFETVTDRFPPEQYNMVVAFLGTDMFATKEKIFNQCIQLGYEMPNIVHPLAMVRAQKIGRGNIIAAGTVIEPLSRIGNGNLFWANSHAGCNTSIGDFNDLSVSIAVCGKSVIGSHCFIGAQSCIGNQVKIADYTLVGASAYVSRDTKPYDVVVPARSIVLEGKKSTDFTKQF